MELSSQKPESVLSLFYWPLREKVRGVGAYGKRWPPEMTLGNPQQLQPFQFTEGRNSRQFWLLAPLSVSAVEESELEMSRERERCQKLKLGSRSIGGVSPSYSVGDSIISLSSSRSDRGRRRGLHNEIMFLAGAGNVGRQQLNWIVSQHRRDPQGRRRSSWPKSPT